LSKRADRLSQGDCTIKEIPGDKYTEDITVKGNTFRAQYVEAK